MDTWILRFTQSRQKPNDPRRLMLIHRSEGGELAEVEIFEIEARQLNLPDVVEGIVKNGHSRLILDLVHEKHVDSNDIAQIVGAMKYAQDAGGELVFANPNARLEELFRITHLNDVMAIYDSIATAADHFNPDQ